MPKVSKEYAERKRQQILEAAFSCFARQGYHRTTMDDVVAASGLSKGAIYGYFAGKEDLFLALREPHFSTLVERMGALPQGGAPVRPWMERAMELFVAGFDARFAKVRRISLEFWAEAPRRAKIKKEFAQIYASWHGAMCAALKAGVDSGEFRADINVDSVARTILAFSDGLTLHWVLVSDRLDCRDVARAFLAELFDGIANPAPPAGVARGRRIVTPNGASRAKTREDSP